MRLSAPGSSLLRGLAALLLVGVLALAVSSAAFLSACLRSLYSNSATRFSD